MANAKLAADFIRREMKRMESLKNAAEILDEHGGFENAYQSAKDSAEAELRRVNDESAKLSTWVKQMEDQSVKLKKTIKNDTAKHEAQMRTQEAELVDALEKGKENARARIMAMTAESKTRIANTQAKAEAELSATESLRARTRLEVDGLTESHKLLTSEVNSLETKLTKIKGQLAKMMGDS